MAETTAIAWCDSTWSPWEGCTKISPACDHCYAARMNRWLKGGSNWGPGAPRLEYGADHWDKPLRWNAKAAKTGKTRLVFPSVCDPFDNEVPQYLRTRFFGLIHDTPHLTWLLLTKRIGNAAHMMWADAPEGCAIGTLPNVWLGSTICNQAEADRDIPKLLATPVAKRFLSIEPMLGPVYVEDIGDPAGGICLKPLAGLRWVGNGQGRSEVRALGGRIDWVICGGESGPGARPMHPDWVRSLRNQCAPARTPFFFKQWGEFIPSGANDADQGLPDVPESRLYWSDGSKWDRHDGQRGGVDLVARVGTPAAGRLLDGREHNEFPAASSGADKS